MSDIKSFKTAIEKSRYLNIDNKDKLTPREIHKYFFLEIPLSIFLEQK